MTDTTASVEAELLALTEDWVAAEVAGDRVALEEILDEAFLVTYPSGRTIGRDAYIDEFVDGDLAPFDVNTESISLHGDTALVIQTSNDLNTKFTWIAVKREGRWRVISETFTRMAEPGA